MSKISLYNLIKPIQHQYMTTTITLITLVIAVSHFYFLVLEMFLWTKPIGLKVFRQNIEKAKVTQVLAANQGLYNGFLSAGLVWAVLHPHPMTSYQLNIFFSSCVLIAGIYGAFSVNKRIFWIQGFPALINLILLLIGAN